MTVSSTARLDITQFFAKIQRESPRGTDEGKLKAPVEQLMYGWDRFDKNKSATPAHTTAHV